MAMTMMIISNSRRVKPCEVPVPFKYSIKAGDLFSPDTIFLLYLLSASWLE
jgi:hypothetical protein